MKKIIEIIKSDKIFGFGFLISFIFIISNLIIIAVPYSKLPPFIPLFNQMPWGEDRFGTKEQIFILPAVNLTIFIINFILSFLLYKKTPLVSRIFSVTTLIISFFTLLFILRIIRLII